MNVAVTAFPLEVLPIFYRYGYAAPFYNTSKAARTIVFGTRNRGERPWLKILGLDSLTEDPLSVVGFHFGILIIWVVISCITLTLFQFLARRNDMAATRREQGDGKQGTGKA